MSGVKTITNTETGSHRRSGAPRRKIRIVSKPEKGAAAEEEAPLGTKPKKTAHVDPAKENSTAATTSRKGNAGISRSTARAKRGSQKGRECAEEAVTEKAVAVVTAPQGPNAVAQAEKVSVRKPRQEATGTRTASQRRLPPPPTVKSHLPGQSEKAASASSPQEDVSKILVSKYRPLSTHTDPRDMPAAAEDAASPASHRTGGAFVAPFEVEQGTELIDPAKRSEFIEFFFADVNRRITLRNQRQVDPTNEAAKWPHIAWISIWGFIAGILIATVLFLKLFVGILDVLTTAFFVAIFVEYMLAIRGMRSASFGDGPDSEPQGPLPKGRIALIIAYGYSVRPGATAAEKAAKRDSSFPRVMETISAANSIFAHEDIFLFHNSSGLTEPDLVVKKKLQGMANYIFLRIGSKPVSLYYGSIVCQRLGYAYTMVMDDDTRLDPRLSVSLRRPLEHEAYCIPIAAKITNADAGFGEMTAELLVSLQDLEYKLSDLAKVSQSNWSLTASTLAPHGAISLWKTDILVKVMKQHNCIFHGEDFQMGHILRQYFPETTMKILPDVPAQTLPPTEVKGLLKQRIKSWDMAAHQFICGGFCGSVNTAEYLQVLFCLPWTVDNFCLRVYTAQDLWTAVQDYVRFPLVFLHLYAWVAKGVINWPVLSMYIVTLLSQLVIAFILNYGKLARRQDLQLKNRARDAVLLFPAYRLTMSFMRVFALGVYVFSYDAIKRTALPISEMHLPLPDVGPEWLPAGAVEVTSPIPDHLKRPVTAARSPAKAKAKKSFDHAALAFSATTSPAATASTPGHEGLGGGLSNDEAMAAKRLEAAAAPPQWVMGPYGMMMTQPQNPQQSAYPGQMGPAGAPFGGAMPPWGYPGTLPGMAPKYEQPRRRRKLFRDRASRRIGRDRYDVNIW